MPNWRFLLAVGLVFLLAIALRFYLLGRVPVSLYWDETAILVDARSIAATGQDMHGNSWLQAILPSYGDYKLAVLIWLASLSVKLLGATELAVRLPSALSGILTMIFGGLIAGELLVSTKKLRWWLFVLTAAVIAIAPWSVLFSRTGFEGHVGQLLLAVSIWCALKARKQWGWGILAALIGGLATYTYFSIRFVWPVVFFLVVTLFTVKKTWRSFLLQLVVPFLLYAVSLRPMYQSPLYEASNQFRLSATSVLNMADWPIVANEYKLPAGNTLLDKAMYHPWVLISRELAKNYADNLSFDFLFLTGDPNLRHGTGRHGLFLWPFFLPLVYGWYTLFPKFWRQGVLLLGWWLVALLPASVPETTPHALRSLNALMPLSLVIAWGVWQWWRVTWQARQRQWLEKGIFLVWSMAVGLALFDFVTYYFQVYPALSAKEWQDGYKAVAHEAWVNRADMDVVWVEPFDPRFYLWLLAYEVPVQEYRQISFNNYMPEAIENIRFRWFDWGKLPTLSEKTMLLARKDLIDWNLETAAYPPRWYKPLVRADKVAEFAAVYFEKVE